MNFQPPSKKFVKILFIITTISFLWLGVFGLFNHMGGMGNDSMVSKCLFNGEAEMCTMSFSEHSTLWQWMMTTLPREAGLLNLLFLMILLAGNTNRNHFLSTNRSIYMYWVLLCKDA